MRGVSGLAALVAVTLCASNASAFCGTCGGGNVAYYAPATYQAAYAPATYQAAYAPATYGTYYGSYSSWYPGYWLDRINRNIWGAPATYAVSYAPTYAASYAPAYSAGYATSYAPACSTCTAGYAPCSTCASPCTSCAQQVTMRPVCTTACAPSCGGSDCGGSCGSGCSSCGAGVVSQAVYQESSGCSSCGQATVAVPAATNVVVPGGQQIVMPGATGVAPPAAPSGSPAPEVAPSEQIVPRTFQKPATDNGDLQPAPANGTTPGETAPSNGGADPLEDALKDNSNANYFEAPKLFDPKDRTAARIAAPVRNAIYERPVSYHRVSTGRITAAQAQQDAAGWTSASK